MFSQMKSTFPFTIIFLVATHLSANPFFVTPKSDAKFRPDAAGVLFEQGQSIVWKSLKVSDEEFDHLYWVNFKGVLKVREELLPYGQVLHFSSDQFAIMRLTDDQQIFKLSATLHEQGMACGALIRLRGDVMQDTRADRPEPVVDIAVKMPVVEDLVATVDAANIEATVNRLEAIHTRYYKSSTGIGMADNLTAHYQSTAGERADVIIDKFNHPASASPQPSLRVRIVGQEKPDEIVVLGSHIDSINGWGSNTARAPGADDNASGTATNLEIFRVLMAKGIKLKRSLEIHGYAAEEIGLVGSQDMAKIYRSENKNVISMVQHDMNLFCASGPDKIWFVSNNTSRGFNEQLITLLKSYLTVAYGSAALSGGNSDHYSWTRNGYHAAFPFENPNNYNDHIHTSGDTSANSGRFSQAAEFARLGLAYVSHFAGIVD